MFRKILAHHFPSCQGFIICQPRASQGLRRKINGYIFLQLNQQTFFFSEDDIASCNNSSAASQLNVEELTSSVPSWTAHFYTLHILNQRQPLGRETSLQGATCQLFFLLHEVMTYNNPVKSASCEGRHIQLDLSSKSRKDKDKFQKGPATSDSLMLPVLLTWKNQGHTSTLNEKH